jgi:integrase
MRSSTGVGTPRRKTVKRGQRTYEYWACEVTENGKRRTLTAKTRAAVVALRDGIVSKPVALPTSGPSLGAFLESWVGRERARVAHGTWRQWESHVRCHLVPRLGGIPIRSLTVGQVEDYLDRNDLDARTRNHHRSTLRVALADAKRNGLVLINVAQDARPARVAHKDRSLLSPSQVKLLTDGTASDRLGPLWAVIGTTGLRISEALGLVWDDVDLDGGLIHVRHTLHRVDGAWQLHEPKTEKSRRSVPLAPATVTVLKRHKLRQMEERLAAGRPGSGGLVFTTVSGRPIHPSNAVALLHTATDRLGLPRCTVHSLRHSVATELTAKGVPIAIVAAWLGHSSSRITEQVYGHLTGSDLTAGAEVMERMVR